MLKICSDGYIRVVTKDHSLNFLCKRDNCMYPFPVSKHGLHFLKISNSTASSQKNLVILLTHLSPVHMPPVSQLPLPYSYLNPFPVPSELPWRYLQCRSHHVRARVSQTGSLEHHLANIAFASSLPPSPHCPGVGRWISEMLREPE